jgi:hypothetical protein
LAFASCYDFSILYYMKQCSQALKGQFAITDWDSCLTLDVGSFPPTCSEYRLVLEFVNKTATYSVARSPSSTIVAVRLEGHPNSQHLQWNRGLEWNLYRMAEDASMTGGIGPIQWSLQYISAKSGMTEDMTEDMTENIRDWLLPTNASSKAQQTFIDNVSSEDWDRIWDQGEVYE